MDVKKAGQKLRRFLEKYKYAAAVLLLGLGLMLLPGFSEKTQTSAGQTAAVPEKQSVGEELEEILSQVQGAGRVRVMLKEASGEELLYQTNEELSQTENGTAEKRQCVTLNDENRAEYGLIRQINPPTYLGAVVLCQGADDPAVKLAIADAVSKITGLGMNKIAVLKME